MKTIITFLNKVFRPQKQTIEIVQQVEEELTEEQFDAWIVSIRQKPQLSTWKTTGTVSIPKSNHNGLEEAGSLVLA